MIIFGPNTFFIFFLTIAIFQTPGLHAQQDSTSGGKIGPRHKLVHGQQLSETPDETVSMSCTVSENGHRWNIVATNTSNQTHNCQSKCYLKTSNGFDSFALCDPSVPPNVHDLTVCTYLLNDVVWSVSHPGSFFCQ